MLIHIASNGRTKSKKSADHYETVWGGHTTQGAKGIKKEISNVDRTWLNQNQNKKTLFY